MENYKINRNSFLKWLDTNNIEYTKEELMNDDDWTFIMKRIKAEIANVLWSRKDFYRALVYNDNQVQASL
jgi:arsenate reductase-like glutaredoxin family protein